MIVEEYLPLRRSRRSIRITWIRIRIVIRILIARISWRSTCLRVWTRLIGIIIRWRSSWILHRLLGIGEVRLWHCIRRIDGIDRIRYVRIGGFCWRSDRSRSHRRSRLSAEIRRWWSSWSLTWIPCISIHSMQAVFFSFFSSAKSLSWDIQALIKHPKNLNFRNISLPNTRFTYLKI